MTLKNTPETYGSVSKFLHWTVAAIVIFQLIVGSWMGDLPKGDFKLETVLLHKSLGILVLFLIVLRILWHLFSRRPQPVPTLTKWERIGARALHDSFYILLIAMPLTGWAMSSGYGASVHFFGLFTLPDFVAKSKAAAHFYREAHGYISDVLIAVVCAHAGAALMHHFYKKDNVLKRMLPALFGLALLGGGALHAQAAVPAAKANIAANAEKASIAANAEKASIAANAEKASIAANAAVQNWTVVHDKSAITFKPTQLGSAFTGHFGVFAATIAFSPDDLAHSHVMIDVHMSTATTGAPDRDANLMSGEWFNVAQFPDAVFTSTAFHKVGKDAFAADGTLTIKGVSVPVRLPFRLDIKAGTHGEQVATADGAVTLDRTAFNIGTGRWKSADVIANQVPVQFHITAISAQSHT